ncbi:hypothetical protein UlMin_006957 [Ulmus minor]
MEDNEVPNYFLCPISLQIMRDPVITVSGITYDRESIEQWFETTTNNKTIVACPVTKQPLPRDSDLTPNHTLRRLIQAWCVANAENGVDRIPTPKSPLEKYDVTKLLRVLDHHDKFPLETLMKMEALAKENDRNRRCMAEAGVIKALVLLVVRCFKEGRRDDRRLIEVALRILVLVWFPNDEIKLLLNTSNEFLDSLSWVLGFEKNEVKSEAILVMKMVMEIANSTQLERLGLQFFKNIMKFFRENIPNKSVIKSSLQILIEASPWGRNRMKIVEAGAVFELVELELKKPEKHITELIFNLLAQLCSCADGRTKLLNHGCGLAMVSKRILRVSPATDDRAIRVLSVIAMFSAKNEVAMEMLGAGVVAKLYMVMQVDCATYLKEKAREILRLHSKVWNKSPCISVYLLTRDPS